MSIRRPVLSNDDLVHKEYTHQTSPRKWTSINYPTDVIRDFRGRSGYRPSWLYQSSHGYEDAAGEMPYKNWIGKRIIYWNGESVLPNRPLDSAMLASVGRIHEYDIAKQLRPNIYRIIFVDAAGNWRTKVGVDYRAGRFNLFIGPDDVIRGVGYF